MATQPERIASLEEFKTNHLRLFWGVTGVAGTWLAFLTVLLITAVGDIKAIKQKFQDGGSGSIVAGLEHPKSPQQLAATLSLVSSQVKLARAEGKLPDQKRIMALSAAVKTAVVSAPQLPETWQAASQLVSYRTASSAEVQTKECGKPTALQATMDGLGAKSGSYQGLAFYDCTLTLDDPTLVNSPAYRAYVTDRIASSLSILKFGRVHLIYRGGPLPPVNMLLFENCTFDFQLNSAPSNPGQSFTKTLLTAQDIDRVHFFPLEGSPTPS